ncbi:AAA-like domain-containing protein [Mesorhizobium sp. WSM2239]|uniref:AAA-like domain-containing protein n=2 Tax=unclassified Mesorhizobium TaxID=325217 RepID=A0AAU8D9P4_9HYPH
MTSLNGPVPMDSPFYVPRTFETEALKTLLAREWVLLLGPRQHGKTSALLRIRKGLADAGFACAFVDLQSLPPTITFAELLEQFARSVARGFGTTLAKPATQSPTLRDWLEAAAPPGEGPIVILVDEASAVRDPQLRSGFFGQMRAMKNEAAFCHAGAIEKRLQFLFAGTFRQESLIDNPANSPFNVSKRIDTDDLGLAGVKALVELVVAPGAIDGIASKIFELVGGQPHLVQTLLSTVEGLDPVGQEQGIFDACAALKVTGNEHTNWLFRTVIGDPALALIASKAAAESKIQNDPTNADYRHLIVLGLLRRDGPHLVFRNPLYEYLAQTPQFRPDLPSTEIKSELFYPIGSGLSFVTDEKDREICTRAYDGAVAAANAGHFRLALVGFGIAIEGLLIFWLSKQPAPNLAAAIAAAKAARPPLSFSRFEVETDPSSWSLANLMRVARQMNGVRGPLEVSEALRNMRNYVHPALMKASYLEEEKLKPEALAAGGLLQSVIRDMQSP